MRRLALALLAALSASTVVAGPPGPARRAEGFLGSG